jgi:hypothetical protein
MCPVKLPIIQEAPHAVTIKGATFMSDLDILITPRYYGHLSVPECPQ